MDPLQLVVVFMVWSFVFGVSVVVVWSLVFVVFGLWFSCFFLVCVSLQFSWFGRWFGDGTRDVFLWVLQKTMQCLPNVDIVQVRSVPHITGVLMIFITWS